VWLKTREDSDPIRPVFPAGAYRFAPDPICRNEKNPAIEIRFPLHFFLSAFIDCLDARAAGATLAEKSCYPETAGKRAIEKRSQKVVVYCGNPSDR